MKRKNNLGVPRPNGYISSMTFAPKAQEASRKGKDIPGRRRGPGSLLLNCVYSKWHETTS